MATKTKERPLALETEPNSQSGNGTAPLSPEILKRLYSYMLKCRTVEEKARTLFKKGGYSGNYYPAVGQEATTVGTTIDLEEADYIAPSHRDFSSHILKGTPLKFLYAQLYARKTSPDQGRSSPAHCGYAPLNVITPSPTIAAQLNIGPGIPPAAQIQNNTNIIMAPPATA